MRVRKSTVIRYVVLAMLSGLSAIAIGRHLHVSPRGQTNGAVISETRDLPDDLVHQASLAAPTQRRVAVNDASPTIRAAMRRAGVTAKTVRIDEDSSLAIRLKADRDRNAYLTTYVGTEITAHSDLPNDAIIPAINKEIAAALKQLDYHPPVRLEHYRWTRERGMNVVGWGGYISSVKPQTQGVWLVEINVRPTFAEPNAGVVHTRDACIERYYYREGKLEFVSLWFDPSQAGPGSLMSD